METIDLGKTPISEDAPSGTDVRSDPVYDALSTEIDKLSSPTAASALDWKRVLQLSGDILGTRSKDLLVLSYLSMALTKTEGLSGLAVGFHVWRECLANFWETMFPAKARMRGRRNAVDWWIEKTTAALQGISPETWPKEKSDAFFEDLSAVDEFLSDNMDDAPTLGPLGAVLSNLITVAEPPAPEPPPPPPAPEAPSPQEPAPRQAPPPPPPPPRASAPPPADTAAPASGDPDRMVRQGFDALRGASGLFARQNAFNPLRFRLNRIVAWASVTGLPTSQDGKTLIPPPDGQIADTLSRLRQAGNWQDLLEAAESRVAEFLFWLDLHRLVVEALDNLGRKPLGNEVSGETALYVKRLPGIERLSFSDGTPFADPDTRQWLEGLTQKEGAASDASDSCLAGQMADQVAAAQDLARDGDLAGALRTLKEKLDGATSARERFLWRLALCRFLTQTGQEGISAPHIEELLQDLDTYHVEIWDPPLAVECLTVVLSGLRARKDDGAAEMRTKALRRLSLIDPAKALSFVG